MLLLPVLLLSPSHLCLNSLPEKREIEKEKKEDHISQSQCCIGDIGIWQPTISNKHLPDQPAPSTSTASSPTLSIDFWQTGLVIANVDLPLCLSPLTCVIPVMYVGAFACLCCQGDCYISYWWSCWLHQIEKKKMLAQWKCVIDWGHKVKYIPARDVNCHARLLGPGF